MKNFSRNFIFIPVFILLVSFLAGCNRPETKTKSHSLNYLMAHLTLKEKIKLLGGLNMSTQPVPRLEIPAMKMDDGPVGARWGRSTSFPAGIAMASSWDTSLVRLVGQGIGREVRGKGRNIILGPNVNIARNPLNGRTFEAFGEDPFLTSAMAVSYIKGVQEEGTGATIKHFDANSQEYHRMYIDENISLRTLHEIYLPAFKAGVQKADVAAVMAAYNQVNGHFSSANHYLLNTILRDEWGYKGLIMSDWGAVHSTLPVMQNALDLEMPYGHYLNDKTIQPLLKSGKVTESMINDKVRNILKTEFRLGLLPVLKHPQHMIDSLINAPETREVALKAAEEGIVLLKNNHHQLPLNPDHLKSVAVIGPNANFARVAGGGSAEVFPIMSVNPLEALRQDLKGKATIHYAPGILFDNLVPVDSACFYQPDGEKHGLKAEYYDNDNFSGQPVTKIAGVLDYRQGSGQQTPVVENHFKGTFSVRWTGKILAPETGDYHFSFWAGGSAVVWLNGKKIFTPKPSKYGFRYNPYSVHLNGGDKYDIKVEYHGRGYDTNNGNGLSFQLLWKQPNNASIANAVDAAKHSDVAIVFAGTSSYYEHEGADRTSLDLPDNQDELIQKVVQANPYTIVVLTTGAPVTMSKWLNRVPAVVETWFDGEEIGNAIANVLLGNYNPSGKLPMTFPESWKQEPLSIQHYNDQDSSMTYSEGLFFGYRYFVSDHIKPLFPFGYGLTYTKFRYSDLNIDNETVNGEPKMDVSFKITNTGKRNGTEIAQLYIHEENPKLKRPYEELKGFSRVTLQPGESKIVHITLNKNAFSYWSPEHQEWTFDHNPFDILIGSSSADIHLKKRIKL